MERVIKLTGKRTEIPRIKVQPERKARWMDAYEAVLEKERDLSFADFVRRAMDAHSDAILSRPRPETATVQG